MSDYSELRHLRVPDGWTLEMIPRSSDHALLTTPSPLGYMATIDFGGRGFRMGYSVTGLCFGDSWNTKRKTYGSRGWRQRLIDDAVVQLLELMR